MQTYSLSVYLVWMKFNSLFLLLFMRLIVFFGTIYESYCIISANFYIYLQYF